MKTLATDTFKKIRPLLEGNYANIHARLGLKLPTQAAAVFSQFTLQPSKGGAEWGTDVSGAEQFAPLSAASPAERQAVNRVLKSVHAEVKKSFPREADKLMQVPDEESILFAPDGSGGVRVLLTRWGFRRVASAGSVNVMRLCLDTPDPAQSEHVEIQVLNADGTPSAQAPYTLHILGKELPFTTDDEGRWSPGDVVVGKSFQVSGADAFTSPVLTVQSGRQIYDITLPAPPETEVVEEVKEVEPEVVEEVKAEEPPEPPAEPLLKLRIIDSKGRPITGQLVKVMCQKGYEEQTTDADGFITLKKRDLVGGEKPKLELRRPKAGGRRSRRRLTLGNK